VDRGGPGGPRSRHVPGHAQRGSERQRLQRLL
jgi:hypothetical protein